jgi:hypothetical protein
MLFWLNLLILPYAKARSRETLRRIYQYLIGMGVILVYGSR